MRYSLYDLKDDPGSSHNLLRYYLSDLPANSKILDIGAATGLLGELMQNHSLKFYGIEPNESWAKKAEPYYEQIFVGQLEEAQEEFLRNYDVVVCADVLEHMADPTTQLLRLVRLQPPLTKFLVCVPNIANIWIRMNLVFGKFEYTNRGILDRTHLRFFTLKSLKELLTISGLSIEKIVPTPIPLMLVNPLFENNPVGRFFQRLVRELTFAFPTLLGYQFFCLAFVALEEEEE